MEQIWFFTAGWQRPMESVEKSAPGYSLYILVIPVFLSKDCSFILQFLFWIYVFIYTYQSMHLHT